MVGVCSGVVEGEVITGEITDWRVVLIAAKVD